MLPLSALSRLLFANGILFVVGGLAVAQGQSNVPTSDNGSNFGPVMRAYLGYLSNEQEVVDDRNSRREISTAYYHRNSNRIRALRQMAIRLVRQSGNDYVPELEAVAVDELRTLFEKPPNPTSFRTNEILANKFRFLGVAHPGEVFYLFARLDPYEQAELMQKQSVEVSRPGLPENVNAGVARGQRVGQTTTRPRRAIPR
ncbi:MAG TPA: hypothetical protein VHE60_18265 [Pyrinomonadaceae bacterium]|nr:hypothetical protein [Pyrinomonadaceae bacterium]